MEGGVDRGDAVQDESETAGWIVAGDQRAGEPWGLGSGVAGLVLCVGAVGDDGLGCFEELWRRRRDEQSDGYGR